MKRVLLVDDDGAILFAFRRLSQTQSASVDTAETVSKARWLIGRYEYDMVIVDLNLKGQTPYDGLEVIRTAKRHNPRIRAFAWTAYESPDVQNLVAEAGAERCFIKPVRYEAILALMRDEEPSEERAEHSHSRARQSPADRNHEPRRR